jgi:serine/threonine protein kinase
MITSVCTAMLPGVLFAQEAVAEGRPTWLAFILFTCFGLLVVLGLGVAVFVLVARGVAGIVSPPGQRDERKRSPAPAVDPSTLVACCPTCGRQLPPGAPQGLCPYCLLQVAVEPAERNDRAAAPTTAYDASAPAPSPEGLAAHFPQLEILELLGKGGMGAVYKARQPHLDRFVALKILPPEAARDPAFAERFAREGRALAKLNHPNIVGVHDFGQQGELYYLVMEYIDGVNLRQAMRAGQLTPEEALRIVPQLCDALQFAHDEGVVHRDIKPENILLDRRGRVKVADFGLAKLLGQSAGDVSLTGTQQVMGTLHYMAPEQLAGARAVDHRADIYSLGVTFYEMLTGELPLGRFPPPSHKAAVDARLDHVVLRTLEHEPADRYQHASDVKTDIESIGDLSLLRRRDLPDLRMGIDTIGRVATRLVRSRALWAVLWTVLCLTLYLVLWTPTIGMLDKYYLPYRGTAESTVSLEPKAPPGVQPGPIERLVVTETIVIRRSGWANVPKGAPLEWQGDGPRSERVQHRFTVEIDLKDGSNRKLSIDGLKNMRWSLFGDEKDGGSPLDVPSALAWMHKPLFKLPPVPLDKNEQPPEELREQARFWVELVHRAANSNSTPEFFVGRQTANRLDRLVWDMRNRWLNDKQRFPFRDREWTETHSSSFERETSDVWLGIPLMLTIWTLGLFAVRKFGRVLLG